MAETNTPSEGSSPQFPLRRILVLSACAIVVIVVVMFISSIGPAWEKLARVDCETSLSLLGLPLREYAAAHNGHFPSTWVELNFTGDDTNIVKLLRCPSTRHDIGIWSQVDLWADYHLIPGRSTNDPPNTILALEPLANHRSAGANVLFVDGTTQWWPASRVLGVSVEAGTNNAKR